MQNMHSTEEDAETGIAESVAIFQSQNGQLNIVPSPRTGAPAP